MNLHPPILHQQKELADQMYAELVEAVRLLREPPSKPIRYFMPTDRLEGDRGIARRRLEGRPLVARRTHKSPRVSRGFELKQGFVQTQLGWVHRCTGLVFHRDHMTGSPAVASRFDPDIYATSTFKASLSRDMNRINFMRGNQPTHKAHAKRKARLQHSGNCFRVKILLRYSTVSRTILE